ncbi:Fic family protein [Phenylobacterium sp. RIFCSPHIGHO2_01_FULL_69_31]|uniref:Fic family protein n=2 Tax=Phenylobacterium TaxID=20 RepID=UPI002600078B|nr:Fic family protein [Phenylobacterium sp. RIFCSPHIGHO2_01_FULL_69_31]
MTTWPTRFTSVAAKEVYACARAMREGFDTVRATGLITINDILAMQATLERNQAGFRRLPGTALKNDKTGEVVFTPPQSYEEIAPLMANLERFINGEDTLDLDPLVKMAVIHHQFETIHPFYDGNGRTGRILNILSGEGGPAGHAGALPLALHQPAQGRLLSPVAGGPSRWRLGRMAHLHAGRGRADGRPDDAARHATSTNLRGSA